MTVSSPHSFLITQRTISMSLQKALVIPSERAPWKLVSDYPVDPVGPKDVLIEVVAVALNPGYWKVQKYGAPGLISEYPFVGGLDGASIIKEVGAEVKDFAEGDRV